ncbi:hypothetical protein SXCC_02255 [Gluconacetobacter sp. SXCC-1]|nr:hypothetical protein SXCC_02255 [Gluconacetobacter sp. SXCC-1]
MVCLKNAWQRAIHLNADMSGFYFFHEKYVKIEEMINATPYGLP